MGHSPHLFIEPPWSSDHLDPGDVNRHHLRVLRLRPGDAVSYTDGAGTVGSGEYDGSSIVRGEETTVGRPVPEVGLAVAAPHRGERLRFVVEKLAELGVDVLIWLETGHGEGSAPRPDKIHSWSVSALEQSRGAWLLEVAGPLGMADVGPFWTERHGPASAVVMAHPGAGPPDGVGGPAWSPLQPVVICIGPEGGFTPGEATMTPLRVGLGARVLRTETAAVVAATLALSRSGRLGD